LGWDISDLVPMLKILLLQVSPVSDVSQPPSFLLLDFCFLTAAGLYSVGFFGSILTSSASQLILKKIHNMNEFLDWPKSDLSSHRCRPAAKQKLDPLNQESGSTLATAATAATAGGYLVTGLE